jgi:hypothetical protein
MFGSAEKNELKNYVEGKVADLSEVLNWQSPGGNEEKQEDARSI